MRDKLQGKTFPTGRRVNVIMSCETYANGGRLAIRLLTDDMYQETYGTLTVNIESVKLEPNEIIVKDWAENEQLAEDAYATGLFEDTGKRVSTGFVRAPIWRVL